MGNSSFFEKSIKNFFQIDEYNSSIYREIIAGITTFLTMCYIIVINPIILSETGMDFHSVFVATCIAAAVGTLIMGMLANYPIALAPGMGLNAYFTYGIVLGMGVPWRLALAAVFVSGLLFIFLNLFKIREAIVNAIPLSLKMSISAGIGLFLAIVALNKMGIVISDPATIISLGDLREAKVLLGIIGFFIIVVLDHYKIRGAIIISILSITFLASIFGFIAPIDQIFGQIPSLSPTFFQLDFEGLFNSSMLFIILILFLVDLFDSTGVLVGVSHRAGLLVDGKLLRLKKALFADSIAIPIGAILGTSSTTPYIESTAGVAAGGRTGLTAVVVGLLFLLCLWVSPLVASIPSYATFPALLYVGILMIKSLVHIDWDDITEAAPAFLTIIFMPFSYSIAGGIAIGFISYAIIKLLCGKARSIPYMVWIIASIWMLKFIVMGN